jgi:glycosyltransferase involved in cell wall biosynthesis
MGHSVLHLSSPVTPLHLVRARREGFRNRFAIWQAGGVDRGGGLREYVPLAVVPWQLSRYFLDWENALLWCLPTLPRALYRLGVRKVDLLVIDQPKLAGIEEILSADRLVYRATDLYPDITGDPRVAIAETRLVKKADLVVATSRPVLEHLRRLAMPKRQMLLENGVDIDHFSAPRRVPPEYRDRSRPLAIYVGALDERLDFGLVRKLCIEIPELTVVLIGPSSVPGVSLLSSLPNALLLGSKPYEEIPGYLQHAQVGLLPLSLHASNRGRSPLKLYEYGASGLPVVGTSTPELSQRDLAFLRLAEGPDQFVAEVRAILDRPDSARVMSDAAKRTAAQHTWSAIAAKLLGEALA